MGLFCFYARRCLALLGIFTTVMKLECYWRSVFECKIKTGGGVHRARKALVKKYFSKRRYSPHLFVLDIGTFYWKDMGDKDSCR